MTTEAGFREIQLNGKQLVFLFMAATVVLVVIFLLGVLVGRDVRVERPAVPESASATVAPDAAAAPPPPITAAPRQAPATEAPAAEPPAPADEPTYFDRLTKSQTPHETLKSAPVVPPPVAETPRQAATRPQAPAPQPAAVVAARPAAESASEPAGPGFAVQVTTCPDRPCADSLAKQLVKKGYPAFVTGPVTSGSRSIYRIRVGKYKDRREAEAISSRLEKEEQFHPWIAR